METTVIIEKLDIGFITSKPNGSSKQAIGNKDSLADFLQNKFEEIVKEYTDMSSDYRNKDEKYKIVLSVERYRETKQA